MTAEKAEEDQQESSLLEDNAKEEEDEEEEEEEDSEEDDRLLDNIPIRRKETVTEFVDRFNRNIVHFFVEDWFLSALLGTITAILSISTDIGIEYLLHLRRYYFEIIDAFNEFLGMIYWTAHLTICVTFASVFCHFVGKQATGSGIPELKVIMSGYKLKDYLTLRTLIAKVVGMTFTLGGGYPVGKEGPFVHMGAIVASLLTRATSACRYNEFFSNEGRHMEMLSSGCAVGIACTFSAPAGGVLYGIESTSKYFAVKNYWKCFFATTCSALVFRLITSGAIVPPHIAGTIVAYYQTNFPNEVFAVEEIPIFALLGAICGVAAALFVFLHRQLSLLRQNNRLCVYLFANRPILLTFLFTFVIGFVTYPQGLGDYFAGKLTYREALVDFISNCTMMAPRDSRYACNQSVVDHWTGGSGTHHPLISQMFYIMVYFLLVAQCVSLYVPSGIFIPSFVMGACGGRIMGELLSMWFPEGFRGPNGPQIWPGLYAVVGAAAYTGAVTHSLSIAVIVWETTGQLCSLLPVLIALMIANAIASFLQPSFYESTIMLKKLPYLADLPPSRISVHIMKIERVMVKDVIFITKDTTIKELRDILRTTNLRSYPYVTDRQTMNLLGSVSRKYLSYHLNKKLGPEPFLAEYSRRPTTPSELFGSFRNRGGIPRNLSEPSFDRNMSAGGSTLLATSPLLEAENQRSVASSLIRPSGVQVEHVVSIAERAALLASPIDIEDHAIDPSPFQLVRGTSLYKVHTLFSLLGLNHAYVTDKGRLVGVVSLKELRETFARIYLKGALAPKRKKSKIAIRLPDTPREPNAES